MTSTAASGKAGPTPASVRLRSIDLNGPAGKLEAVVNEGRADAACAALLCHPHPLGGGTLHNKVVYHAMKALNAPSWGLNWPVLRFNFRGTGRSEGPHDGAAEADDVIAALEWLENEYALPIVAVGFSFGAAMTLNACARPGAAVKAVAALGLPIRVGERTYNYSFLSSLCIPKLFISGDGDEFAPVAELEDVVSAARDPKKLVLVPGADHFFAGQLAIVQSALVGWLKEQVL